MYLVTLLVTYVTNGVTFLVQIYSFYMI